MKSIFKYPLVDIINQVDITINMPMNATVHHVAIQNGVVTLWAEVEKPDPGMATPLQKDGPRTFRCVYTGDDVENYPIYIGTFSTGNYQMVYHIFEIVPLFTLGQ